jgi:hypothetical protein
MTTSEKVAVAAHLHVLLRRKTGRVTDIEWMAVNRVYASEIVRFSREQSLENGHADLAVWADKLEEVMATTEPTQRQPLARVVLDAVSKRGVAQQSVRDQQGGRSVNTEDEPYPASGFIESSLDTLSGEVPEKKLRPGRYVNGLR